MPLNYSTILLHSLSYLCHLLMLLTISLHFFPSVFLSFIYIPLHNANKIFLCMAYMIIGFQESQSQCSLLSYDMNNYVTVKIKYS